MITPLSTRVEAQLLISRTQTALKTRIQMFWSSRYDFMMPEKEYLCAAGKPYLQSTCIKVINSQSINHFESRHVNRFGYAGLAGDRLQTLMHADIK